MFNVELEIALSYLPGGGRIGLEPLEDHIENIQDTLNPTIAHMLDMVLFRLNAMHLLLSVGRVTVC
jgi:hypothetical protein